MTEQQKMMVGGLVAVVCLLVLGALLGRSCSHTPAIVSPVGIDAGPGVAVIQAQLDASIQADEAAIHELEERNARSMQRFDDDQAAEYAQVRSQGRQAVAAWLSDFNTQLKTDAGP